MNLFKKAFVFVLIFTAASWSMAWIFSAMAGETPKSTIKKLKSRLNEGQLVEEKEILDLAGVESIAVDTSSADITVDGTVADQATVEYAGTVSPGGKMLKIERTGNRVMIGLDPSRGVKGFAWNFDDDDSSLKVTTFTGLRLSLPANIAKNLKIQTHSGDIKLKKISADSLEIRATSGDITLEDCAAHTLGSLQTSSGDIEVRGFKGKLRTSSTSGEFEGERIAGDDLESQSTSGDIELKLISVGALRAQATSGDISVLLREAKGWKFSLSATSGNIKNDFSDDVNADKVMQIRSTSGDIRVRR